MEAQLVHSEYLILAVLTIKKYNNNYNNDISVTHKKNIGISIFVLVVIKANTKYGSGNLKHVMGNINPGMTLGVIEKNMDDYKSLC